ncbi:MAG TPA: hypothetical protein PKY31_11195 [Spirochaetota bacterium]|nr:hypothetical protein [Spirochaetota bacterium]
MEDQNDIRKIKTAVLLKKLDAAKDPESAAGLREEIFELNERLSSLRSRSMLISARGSAHDRTAQELADRDDEDPKIDELRALAADHRRDVRDMAEEIEKISVALARVRMLFEIGTARVEDLKDYAGKFRQELAPLLAVLPKKRSDEEKAKIAELQDFLYFSESRYLNIEMAGLAQKMATTESDYLAAKEAR